MKPRSVIVDVAVDQGGCVETTHETTHDEPIYVEHGVVHYAVGNMPGAVPHTSTFALTNATLPYQLEVALHGAIGAARRDPSIAHGLNTVGGAQPTRPSPKRSAPPPSTPSPPHPPDAPTICGPITTGPIVDAPNHRLRQLFGGPVAEILTQTWVGGSWMEVVQSSSIDGRWRARWSHRVLLAVDPALLRSAGRAGRRRRTIDVERGTETFDEPLLGDRSVAKLRALVVGDDADHRAELRPHTVALRVAERPGRLDVEGQFRPRGRLVRVLATRSTRWREAHDQFVARDLDARSHHQPVVVHLPRSSRRCRTLR